MSNKKKQTSEVVCSS